MLGCVRHCGDSLCARRQIFFSDNPDLDFHLRQSGFLQELYALTSTQDRDAVAASTAEEYEQAWLQALASFGEVVGSEVAPHTRQVEDEKLSVDELGNLLPGPAAGS